MNINRKSVILAQSGIDYRTERMYTCDVCGYQTERRYNYLRHQETHKEEGTSEEEAGTSEEEASEKSFSESEESGEEEESLEYEDGDVWDGVMETSFDNLKEFDSLVDECDSMDRQGPSRNTG